MVPLGPVSTKMVDKHMTLHLSANTNYEPYIDLGPNSVCLPLAFPRLIWSCSPSVGGLSRADIQEEKLRDTMVDKGT